MILFTTGVVNRKAGMTHGLIKRIGLFSLLALTGCTVVSYDRVFPKLTWYWSSEAKAQRQTHKRIENPWPDSSVTNNDSQRFDYLVYSNSYVNPALVEKVRNRDGTNFLGVYMGMIAELDGGLRKWDSSKQCFCGEPVPPGVQMFSATSGELLRWISAEEFTNVYILKTKPEYPK